MKCFKEWAHRLLMAFGILCGIAGVVISVLSIVKAFKENSLEDSPVKNKTLSTKSTVPSP